MLGGVHYLPNGGTNITLIWGADLYAILIQTFTGFCDPTSRHSGYSTRLSFEFMYAHV